MKLRKLIIVSFIVFAATLWADDSRVPPTICPEPVECDISADEYFALKRVIVSCPDKKATEWAQRHLREWYGKLVPKVESKRGKQPQIDEEGYMLNIGKDVEVTASTLQGVRYALYSLRQIAMPKRGTLKTEGWIVPRAKITDRPGMTFRGIHICWFHESQPQEIERFVVWRHIIN